MNESFYINGQYNYCFQRNKFLTKIETVSNLNHDSCNYCLQHGDGPGIKIFQYSGQCSELTPIIQTTCEHVVFSEHG